MLVFPVMEHDEKHRIPWGILTNCFIIVEVRALGYFSCLIILHITFPTGRVILAKVSVLD